MSTVLLEVKEVYFSTGIKRDNSPPYCGQLPALEEIEPALC